MWDDIEEPLDISSDPEWTVEETSVETLNETLTLFNSSPKKVAKVNQQQKIMYAKKKLQLIKHKIEHTLALDVPLENVQTVQQAPASECTNCKDFAFLVTALKEQCSTVQVNSYYSTKELVHQEDGTKVQYITVSGMQSP